QDLRLCLRNLGEFGLQDIGDAAMQLLATTAQQGVIGDVLYQRVLKRIFRVGRRAAPEYQLGPLQLRQGGVQLHLRHSRTRTDKFVRERASERRPELGHLARWRQAIKSCKE